MKIAGVLCILSALMAVFLFLGLSGSWGAAFGFAFLVALGGLLGVGFILITEAD